MILRSFHTNLNSQIDNPRIKEFLERHDLDLEHLSTIYDAYEFDEYLNPKVHKLKNLEEFHKKYTGLLYIDQI